MNDSFSRCNFVSDVAFSLAGHKNRLQMFPVPGEIHKPPRVDECCRVDKMPFTSSEQESDQVERTRWWTKIMWVQMRESDGANKEMLTTNTGTVQRTY